ncbi:dipeptidase [Vibrio superstes]|nr:membrane dipeptidase [Vibrio superstes]
MKNLTLSLCTIMASLFNVTAVHSHDIGHEHEHLDGGWNSKAGYVSDTDPKSYLWNPRGKSKEEIATRIQFLTEAYIPPSTPEQEARDALARKNYAEYIAINSLMATAVAPAMAMNESHFQKGVRDNEEAGITLISASVYNTEKIFGDTMPTILKDSKASTVNYGGVVVDKVADIRKAKQEGKVAVMFNTQGADYVVGDIESQTIWSARNQIKVMNTTYNNANALAGGGSDKVETGLTDAGKRFVKYANQQGIVLDCSHASNQTCIDTAEATNKPMIASHSNAAAVYNHTRNLSDDAILAIGETDGAVCPTGAGGFLAEDGKATPEVFAEHVVHIAKLIGKDKTCYSTDVAHNVADFYAVAVPRADIYPPELGMAAPISNLHAKHIWSVVSVLEDKYKWTHDEIVGFLGENLMRVYEANWRK